MKTLVFLAVLTATSAQAAVPPRAVAFDTRVAAATAAIATREGFIYDTAMVPALHHALLPCVPPGTGDSERGPGFTLVADVDAAGRLHEVDVRPSSAVARCFAKIFGATRLRPPPLRASHTWPIVVRMRTRP